jgi:hypothetical protein
LKTEILPNVQNVLAAINIIKCCLDTGNPLQINVHCMAIDHHQKVATDPDTWFMVCGAFSFDPKLKWDNYMKFLELR